MLFLSSCQPQNTAEVVVYTSVDQLYSEPILQQFQQETGIHVKAVYDAEAVKTVGLEKRLLLEKKHPSADIFWNSEQLRSQRLIDANVIQSTPDTRVEFGIRARVFVVNTDLVAKNAYPHKLSDLMLPIWRNRAAISDPYFGTASTHFAALLQSWGSNKFTRFLSALKANNIAVLPGNANVSEAVAKGDYAVGLVDTDDANVVIRQGHPVIMIYPDQDALGAFSLFHTASITENAPNPNNARKLIAYLAQASTENRLLDMGAVQFPRTNATETKLWRSDIDQLNASLIQSIPMLRHYFD